MAGYKDDPNGPNQRHPGRKARPRSNSPDPSFMTWEEYLRNRRQIGTNFGNPYNNYDVEASKQRMDLFFNKPLLEHKRNPGKGGEKPQDDDDVGYDPVPAR